MKCLSCLSLPRRRVCWGGFTGWLVFWICWLDVCSVRLNDFRSWVHLWQRFPLSSFQRWRFMFDLGKDRSDWDEDPGSLIWISSTRASWVAKKFEQTSGVIPWQCRCIYFLDSCTYFRKLLENVGLLHVPLGKIEARQKKLARLPTAGIQWKELLIGSLSLSLEWHCAPLVLQSFDINRHEPKCLQLCAWDIWWILFHSKTLLVSKTLQKESWPKGSIKRPRQIFLQNRILSCNMYVSKFMDWTCDCIVPNYIYNIYVYII